MSSKVVTILDELSQVFALTDVANESLFLEELAGANQIVCVGAGRVGLALAGFAKRLRHLGKDAFWIGDQTLPRMGEGDLMLIGSGSGETQTIVGLGELGLQQGLKVALVSSAKDSRLSKIAHVTVVLNCPNKSSREGTISSQQPMTSLFEQSCHIYLDAIVLELMLKLGISNAEMEDRHNAIE
jgi:6-phospho-3-hexuloisomerase